MFLLSNFYGGVMREFLNRVLGKAKKEFRTVPNMLSLLRILLIPVIVYFYCFEQDSIWTLIVVAFSTLTDVVDGFIARKFNQITDIGKLLDPVADKLTQLTVFACLITRFKLMILPFCVLLVKEVGSLILRMVVYKKTNVVEGAHWHGKMSTGIVILVVVIHLIWPDVLPSISGFVIFFSTIFMVYSGFLYTIEGVDILKHGKRY